MKINLTKTQILHLIITLKLDNFLLKNSKDNYSNLIKNNNTLINRFKKVYGGINKLYSGKQSLNKIKNL